MQFSLAWQQDVQTVESPSATGTGTEIVDIHFNQLHDNPDEEEPNCVSQSTTPGPSSAKKPKFYWKWNKEAEAWLLNKCVQHHFSRCKQTKMDIFHNGLMENMWADNVTWRMRVFNKIDTVCKSNS